MKRTEKQAFVNDFGAHIDTAAIIIVTRYIGMNVKEIEALRIRAAEAAVSFRVAKNSLMRRAIAETSVAPITPLLVGANAFAWSDDPIAAARVVSDYNKINEKLVILGGASHNQLLSAEQIKAYAALPSLDALRARLIGTLIAPAQHLAILTAAPAGQIARLLAAYSEKQGEAAA